MITEQELNAAFSTFVAMIGNTAPVVVVVADQNEDGDEVLHTLSNVPSVAVRIEVMHAAISCVMDADYQSVTPIIQPH